MKVFEGQEDRKTFLSRLTIIAQPKGREEFILLDEFSEAWTFCDLGIGKILRASVSFFTFKCFQSFDVLFGQGLELEGVVDAFIVALIDLESLLLHG